MKEQLIRGILHGMAGIIDSRQADELRNVLCRCLQGVEVTEQTGVIGQNEAENIQFLNIFIAAKRVEGCSEKTLVYYTATIEKMFSVLKKWVKDITTDDLRAYLAQYQQGNNSSKVTIDNIRRVFSSFFSWLEDEDYIVKSPVRRIHKVKTAKIIKEAFTDEHLEVLRDTCGNVRNLALVEMLSSTGIRVGELVRLNRENINFNERSCIVFGKGNCEREVYFDARTKLHLLAYFAKRTDSDPALFVSDKQPHKRLTICGVERVLRKLGEKAEIARVHPHRFRRTLATMAIDKGMPIEQVQKLLGHVRIDTTLRYAMVNQSNVKNSHRKFIG
ncbi:integrase [Spirochaetia bacterium]|nr:integrase [Spirochaetia bacterium]